SGSGSRLAPLERPRDRLGSAACRSRSSESGRRSCVGARRWSGPIPASADVPGVERAIERAEMTVIELASEDLVVHLIPELGCRVHRIQFRGVDLLRTPPMVSDSYREPFLWSGFLMAPWANRMPEATFEWGGERHRLQANFSDGSAIHGL